MALATHEPSQGSNTVSLRKAKPNRKGKRLNERVVKLTESDLIKIVNSVINEQTTPPATCSSAIVEKCAGAIGPPIGTQSHFPCVTLNGQPLVPGDAGKEVRLTQAPSGHKNTSVMTIISVDQPSSTTPSDITEEPCPSTTQDPYWCIGGVAGMSCIQSASQPGPNANGPHMDLSACQNSGCGGPTPPPSCNKSCDELTPKFKKKAGNKPCYWLNKMRNIVKSKLLHEQKTGQPGSCRGKKLSCMLRVLTTFMKQRNCNI
jgi:hypothetical protein